MRQVARERVIDRQLSSGMNEQIDESEGQSSEDDVSYIDEVDDSSDEQSMEQVSQHSTILISGEHCSFSILVIPCFSCMSVH
jgi:hypothetical protein